MACQAVLYTWRLHLRLPIDLASLIEGGRGDLRYQWNKNIKCEYESRYAKDAVKKVMDKGKIEVQK